MPINDASENGQRASWMHVYPPCYSEIKFCIHNCSKMDGPLKKVKLHLSKNECKSSGDFVSFDVCYKPAVHS